MTANDNDLIQHMVAVVETGYDGDGYYSSMKVTGNCNLEAKYTGQTRGELCDGLIAFFNGVIHQIETLKAET